jgi:hypothetical protein
MASGTLEKQGKKSQLVWSKRVIMLSCDINYLMT